MALSTLTELSESARTIGYIEVYYNRTPAEFKGAEYS